MSEVEKFSQYSHSWWDENGQMKMLHKINPIRVGYILKIIEKNGMQIDKIDILDVGCGCGILSESLAKMCNKIVGIDASKSNIEVAKSHMQSCKINNIEYLHTSEKCDKKFDVILIMEVLEHVDDIDSFITEKLSLAKEKSIVVISTINRNLISTLFAKFAAEYILKIVPKGTHDASKFLTPSEINLSMEACGFKNIDISGMCYNPLNSQFSITKSVKMNYFMAFKSKNYDS